MSMRLTAVIEADGNRTNESQQQQQQRILMVFASRKYSVNKLNNIHLCANIPDRTLQMLKKVFLFLNI